MTSEEYDRRMQELVDEMEALDAPKPMPAPPKPIRLPVEVPAGVNIAIVGNTGDQRNYSTRFEITDAVMKPIRRLDGVEAVSALSRYKLSVTKGQSFEWWEIEAPLFEFFRVISNGLIPDESWWKK